MKKCLFTMMFAFAFLMANALNYSVTVPMGTNACYIAGDMNGWKHQLMRKVDDTHYTINIPNAKITHKYKYCSGPGWGYVEKAFDGSEINNRTYFTKDVVAKWVAVYDKSITDENLVFNVTVPKGTNSCYISGAWDSWKGYQEMEKLDETHFTTTILTNKLMRYFYSAGPGPGYVEMNPNSSLREDRTYATHDEVSKWVAVYDKAVPDANITYSVTVPEGTNGCYIAGGWNGWSSIKKMNRIDKRHYSVTFRSNKALKYIFLSGPDWKYVEADPAKTGMYVRSYSPKEEVVKWKAVWMPKK